MASQRTKDGSKASTQFGAGGRPKAGSLLVNTKNVSRRDGQSVSFKLHHEESAELKELKEILGPNMSMPDFVLSAARTWRDSKNSTAALLISSNEDAIDALAKQSNERFARLETAQRGARSIDRSSPVPPRTRSRRRGERQPRA